MTIVRRVLMALAGLLAGLLLLEGAFRLRDRGAFPHLNVYTADARLGVRLQAGSTEVLSFSRNPPSTVRINAEGYRGADWPARADNEIFVVGDSQAFGLGVNEEDAFAWKLGKRLGRPVANGAVPTYGPEEYNAVLAEELPRRKPKTVVYTINIANDLFEASHPNRERHAVWDGWAVRKETAPAHVTEFPGRAWLYGRSHAFFAVRGLYFRASTSAEQGSTPSEGGWSDLVAAGQSLSAAQAHNEEALEAERKRRDAALLEAQAEVRKIDASLGDKISAALPEEEVGANILHAARAQPGDIVYVSLGEGSRPVPVIADEIRRAAELRRRFEQKLKDSKDQAGIADLKRHDQLDDRVQSLKAQPFGQMVRARSPLRAHLEVAKQLCDANGAELVVLVLPLDVMVSAEEWKKYGQQKPLDLSATRVLADDILTMADELGARSVDAWPALSGAEPGAFLWGDLHMTPKGHAAVAAAIAEAMAHPQPPRPKLAELPLGRSPVPTPEEWKTAGPASIKYGLDASDLKRFGCTSSQVREWMRFSCKGGAMRLVKAGRSEAMVLNTDDGATLVAATLEGAQFSALRFGKKVGELTVRWAAGEEASEGSLYDAPAKTRNAPPPVPSELERALCACHKQLTGAADCVGLVGAATSECDKAYHGQCRQLLACGRGDASSPPLCEHGSHVGGIANRCVYRRFPYPNAADLEDLLEP